MSLLRTGAKVECGLLGRLQAKSTYQKEEKCSTDLKKNPNTSEMLKTVAHDIELGKKGVSKEGSTGRKSHQSCSC